MRILHTSDLHGRNLVLADVMEDNAHAYDVWVDSGDFFPNKTRGDSSEEIPFQKRFWLLKDMGRRIVTALAGRPLVCVGGNHDYVDLAALVRAAGGIAHNVTDGPVVIGGVRFAGFREVPWLYGEWNGETHDFSEIVENVMGQDPHVLVTHGPAAGILDVASDGRPCGVRNLTTRLMYGEHGVRAHLFGHIHDQGGSTIEEGGIFFSNAATSANIVSV